MTLPRLQSQTRESKVKRRYPGHEAWVRKHHCCVPGCNGQPVELAHVRKGTDGGGNLKPSSWWTISLCHYHHIDDQHIIGEPAFERKHGIDMKALATEFASKSDNPKVREMAGKKAALK